MYLSKLLKNGMGMLFVFLILSSLSQGKNTAPPKYWPYFWEAGKKYNIDPKILVAIGLTESSINHKAINKANRNKTIDVGVMQINSCHFNTLKKYTDDLNNLYDPRFNIHVGAWVLKRCMKRFDVSWRAIDCYNKGAGNARNTSGYVKKVNKHYEKIRHASWENP